MRAVDADGPESLDAVVLTHCHGDHAHGAATLSRRLNLPLYVTPGTKRWLHHRKVAETQVFVPGDRFAIGDLLVQSAGLWHDAPDTVALRFYRGDKSFAVCTDLGETSAGVEDCLRGSDTLMIESNHDVAMLWGGAYPMKLKKRVTGRWGHLSNEQTADLLDRVLPGGTRRVLLAHLSEKNNTPEKALAQMGPLRTRFPHVGWSIAPAHRPAPFEYLEQPTFAQLSLL